MRLRILYESEAAMIVLSGQPSRAEEEAKEAKLRSGENGWLM